MLPALQAPALGNTQVSRKKTIHPDQYGTLGHVDEQVRLMPTRLDKELFGESAMYTWCDGEYGALGHNDKDDKLVLTKLDCDLFRG
jgi:hypothetical protein